MIRRLLLLGACAALLGCPTESGPIQRRPLTIATSFDLAGVNELLGGSRESHEIRAQMFLELLDEQPDYQDHPPTFAPQLASRWEVADDQLSITFHLRTDAVWSDGMPITAEDVRWTWQAQTDEAVAWSMSYIKEVIEDVEVLDPHTVRFVFRKPYRNQLLDANDGFILPKHAWGLLPFTEWRGNADWFREHLVVSGPYALDDWKPQQEISLVANPRYHEVGRPRIDRVVFRVIPDQTAQLSELLAGTVDLVEGLRPADVGRLRSRADLEIAAFPSGQYNYLCWNLGRPPLDEVAVRRALTQAVDRNLLVEALWQGFATVAVSPIPHDVWAHDRALEPWPYAPEEARRALDTAGWTDHDADGVRDKDGRSFTLELLINTGSQVRQDAAVMIQQQLARVGVGLEIRAVELQTWAALAREHQFDVALGGWTADTSLDFRWVFHSSEAAGGSNFGGYANPEVDALLDRIQRETDLPTAGADLRRLQRILHDEQPYTFLWESQRLLAVQRRVKGLRPSYLQTTYRLADWQLAE